MSDMLPGDPPTKAPDDTISAFLANQANEAIHQGADPHVVTTKLGQMVAHLRNNPAIHQQANEAITLHGATPFDVAGKLAKMSAGVNYDGSEAHAGVVPSLLRGATVGLSDKMIAGASAAGDAVGAASRGGDIMGTLGDSYKQNFGARRAAADQYHNDHPVIDTTADLAGSMAPIILSGGLGAAGEAVEATRLGQMGKAISMGTKYGAANAAGRSDALESGRGVTGLATDAAKGAGYGAVGGALSIPATALVGSVANRIGIPQAASSAMSRMGRILPPGRMQRAFENVGRATGEEGPASLILAKKNAQDVAGGFTHEPLHPSVPPLAIDQAGPNVQNVADRIANQPGEGQATVRTTLLNRQKQMLPAVTNELEQGTGVKASERLAPLKDAVESRRTADNTNYPAAFEATKDQIINSPTLDRIKQTATGKKAFAWAGARQSNLVPDLADGVTPPDPSSHAGDLYDKLLKLNGGDAKQAKAGLKALGYSDDIINPHAEPTESKGYDPQTVHLVKRYLAHVAKLGMDDGQQGIAAAEAHGAMGLWGNVRNELPAVVRAADDVSAKNARIVDATNTGRKIFQARINPPAANANKALNTSLGEVDARNAAASPEEQQALQRGAAVAAHARLLTAPKRMQSPGTIMAPTQEKVEQLAHAFPSPDKAEDFQHAVQSWDRTAAQAQNVTGGSQTAGREANAAADAPLVRPGAVFARSPKMVLRRIADGLEREYQAGQSQKVDASLAKILMNPNMKALPDAIKAGATRGTLMQALRLGVGGVGGETTEEHRPF